MKAPPPKLPPSGEQLLAQLESAGLVREEGTGDPPPWTAPPQKLTIIERDGKTSVFDFGSDAAYLSLTLEEEEA